jgi:hypothetical protein
LFDGRRGHASMDGYGGRGGIDGCLMGGEASSMVGYGGRGGMDGCLMRGEATSMVG